MIDSLLQHAEPRMFVVPERTLVGDGASRRLSATLASFGCTAGPVGVVADDAVVRLGLADAILDPLRSAGFTPTIVGHVAAEPTPADARRALAALRQIGPVAVVGIGGGSALDLAKFVALAAPRAEEVEAYYGTRDDVVRSLALAAIPTTAGTGSEVTRIAMLSVDKRKVIISAAGLIPDIVALDPDLVLSLPKSVTAATGLDALCHAIEALLSTNRTPLSIANSRQGLRLIARWLRRSYEHPGDVEARRGMLYGAHFAGRGLNAGVILGHSIGYTIANRTSVAHGISCAMALPYCLRYAEPGAQSELSEIASEVTGRPDLAGLVAWVWEINDALAVPRSLEAVGIATASAPELAAECHERYPRPNNPSPLDQSRLAAMYAAMAAGDTAATPFR